MLRLSRFNGNSGSQFEIFNINPGNTKGGSNSPPFGISRVNIKYLKLTTRITIETVFQLSSKTPWNFLKQNKVILEASICNLLMDGCWGSILPKVMRKIQKALSKIFIDLAIKTY